MPPTVKAYVMRLVTFQINQREREHIMRKDFMQFLIQIRNAGCINADDSDWRIDGGAESTKTLSIEQCAAQVFLFYLAGFDTSASVAAYTVFETSRNRRVLELLQHEIDETLARHSGELTYEGIAEMKYLELCVMGKQFDDDDSSFVDVRDGTVERGSRIYNTQKGIHHKCHALHHT